MQENNVLRYDGVSMEAYLQALNLHEQNAARGVLPSPATLRAVKVTGDIPGTGEPWPFELYSCAEFNPLSGEIESFVVLRGPMSQVRALEAMSIKLRAELTSKGIKTLFRIDPRYGLIMGAVATAVDPAVRSSQPYGAAVLYLTDDPAHPALALLDYVAKDARKRYEDAFRKYNGLAAKGAPTFNFSLGKLLGKKTAVEPLPPVSPIRYARLRTLLIALSNQFLARNLTLSFIFASVTPEDQEKCLLDRNLSVLFASGTPAFFGSPDELLAS
jgi:hypothetical protein